MQNVRINDDFDRQKERFGKFLFSVRQNITKDELSELFELIFRIHQFRQLSVTEQDESDEGEIRIPDVLSETNVSLSPAATSTYPDLPVEFDPAFRENVKAIILFYRLLQEAGPYIGRPKKSKSKSSASEARFRKWKWPHLQKALERLKLLTSNAGNRVFADYMSSVFPDRSSDSIYRALYRFDDPNSPSIVSDIVTYFRPVRDCLENP